jgi:predicted lipoprotein with Yx(FWY)xxD motif
MNRACDRPGRTRTIIGWNIRIGGGVRIALAVTALAVAILGTGMTAAGAEDYGIFTVHESKLGKVLADPNGMTVYTRAIAFQI